MIDVRQCEAQEFVGQYGANISKPEERMICEDRLEIHGTAVNQRLMSQCGKGL